MDTHHIIKICGMRDADNIRAVEQLGVDYLGFIFWSKSKRYVSEPPAYLPTRCKRVGVFVNALPDDILRLVNAYLLDAVQLHGQESPHYIECLRKKLLQCGDVPPLLIKAFNIATPDDLDLTREYDTLVDYFLFDTKGKQAGGNGTQFDWSVLEHYHGQTPFFLSGGIGPDDAERILAFHHPQFRGIDLNSRFETAPGLKDINKLRNFLNYE